MLVACWAESAQAARAETSARCALALAAAKRRPPEVLVQAGKNVIPPGPPRPVANHDYFAALKQAKAAGRHLVVWVGCFECPDMTAGLTDCVQCWLTADEWKKLCPDSKLIGGVAVGCNDGTDIWRTEMSTNGVADTDCVRRVIPAPQPQPLWMEPPRRPYFRGNC